MSTFVKGEIVLIRDKCSSSDNEPSFYPGLVIQTPADNKKHRYHVRVTERTVLRDFWHDGFNANMLLEMQPLSDFMHLVD